MAMLILRNQIERFFCRLNGARVATRSSTSGRQELPRRRHYRFNQALAQKL